MFNSSSLCKIDNETTRNCQSVIEYYEKDFYNIFAFKKAPFKISSLINTRVNYSFISIPAEYKHGINDYTLKDKELFKLPVVFEEIKQLTNVETRFNIDASESVNCLKKCIMNEKLYNDEFVEQILLTKKLLKLQKRKKAPVIKDKKVVPRSNLSKNNKVRRAEAFKQKILLMSGNAVKVVNYTSSKEKVTFQCTSCGFKWDIRSDHLLRKPYCPSCRKKLIL